MENIECWIYCGEFNGCSIGLEFTYRPYARALKDLLFIQRRIG